MTTGDRQLIEYVRLDVGIGNTTFTPTAVLMADRQLVGIFFGPDAQSAVRFDVNYPSAISTASRRLVSVQSNVFYGTQLPWVANMYMPIDPKWFAGIYSLEPQLENGANGAATTTYMILCLAHTS